MLTGDTSILTIPQTCGMTEPLTLFLPTLVPERTAARVVGVYLWFTREIERQT
jgi:hypothetical protein